MSTSLIWAQGIAFGVVAALMPTTAALVATLLAPGLLALVLDRQAGRPIARAMLLFGLAAAIPLRQLWDTPLDIQTSLLAVAQLETLGVAWLAAATGWFLSELFPVAIHVMLDAGSKARASRLRAAREKLLETWAGALTP